jgi:hypothetical protein
MDIFDYFIKLYAGGYRRKNLQLFIYLFIYLFFHWLTLNVKKCNRDKTIKKKGALKIMKGTLTSKCRILHEEQGPAPDFALKQYSANNA